MFDKLIKETITQDTCAYLDNTKQTTHYKIINNCSTEYCELLIERGWRRFGAMFFRPVCDECNKCESLKIDVNNFIYSKSQRRIKRKNAATKMHIRKPKVTQEHLDLFEKYHLYMKDKREWSHSETDAKHYYASFVHGHGDFGYEILYFIQNKLVGIDLVDILPNGISSIYFYYDPDYEQYSLGTYSMLQQIQIAKDNNLDWIYMGYYVQECQSLAYKNRYTPYQILQGRPEEESTPTWI